MSGADRCLVTGASGFIGSHVARRLAADGVPVRGLVRSSSDASALDGIELATGDLTDAGSLTRAAAGCRHVVHCGALVSDWATVAEIRQINVTGTRNVLEAARGAGVERVIHISTTDVYGYPATPAVGEQRPSAGFANWYAQSKREAEAELRRAARGGRLETVLLRPATVYGPGSQDVVGEMARAIRGGHMLMIDHGRGLAGLTYVENVVDAIVLALRADAGAAAGRAFNVSDGLDVTWQRFLGDLADGLGCPPPRLSLPYGVALAIAWGLEHGYRVLRGATGLSTPALLSRQAVHVLGRSQDFSHEELRRRLHWEPRVGYEEGLAATLAWLHGRDAPPPALGSGQVRSSASESDHDEEPT